MKKTNDTEIITSRWIHAMREIIAGDNEIDSRYKFAAKVGYTPANLSEIENGKGRSVTVSGIAKICKEFKVSPDWLILGRGEMFTG